MTLCITDDTEKEVTKETKKESKKKKKKDVEKECKMDKNKIESAVRSKDSQDNNVRLATTELVYDNTRESCKSTGESAMNLYLQFLLINLIYDLLNIIIYFIAISSSRGTGLCRFLTWIIVWLFVISSLLTIALVICSWHYEQQTDRFLQNVQTLSGLPLKNYYKHTTDLLQRAINVTTAQIKSITDMANDFYEAHFKSNINNAEKEL